MDQPQNTYKVAMAGAMIVAISYGWGRYNYGLFLPEIKSAFDLSPYWLGLIGSLSYTEYLLATLFASTLAALLGPRLLITVGGLCASTGLLIVSQAQSTISLLLGLIIAGISPGLCYPPLSDVVVQMYKKQHQARAYAFMNTGTGFGVILAGPLALMAGTQWREAWLLFAVVSFVITYWNWRLMPSKTPLAIATEHHGLPPLNWLFNRRRASLFLLAFGTGLASSVYWTFSVDIITEHTQGVGFLGMDAQFGTRLFWIILGAAGCFGVVAGDLVRGLGLSLAIKTLVVLQSISLLLLGLAPASTFIALISAALFGSSFIILTAFVGVWAVHSFHQRPSAGFGLAFFMMSIGQFIGPFMMGIIAEIWDLKTAFLVGAGLCVCLLLLTPKENIRGLTPSI